MKRLVLIIALFVGVSTASVAQDYSSAVGVRVNDYLGGISFKHKMNSVDAIEAVLTIPYESGFGLMGLYERHLPVITEGFNFYYGLGAHIGSFKYDKNREFVIGADGVIGLEYKFKSIPLALSLDYIPALNIIGDQGLYFRDFGFGIKVTF